MFFSLGLGQQGQEFALGSGGLKQKISTGCCQKTSSNDDPRMCSNTNASYYDWVNEGNT